LLMFVLSYFLPGVNNAAHGGGFVGGLLAGLVLSLAGHRREAALGWVLAGVSLARAIPGVARSPWAALAPPRPASPASPPPRSELPGDAAQNVDRRSRRQEPLHGGAGDVRIRRERAVRLVLAVQQVVHGHERGQRLDPRGQ